MHVKRYLRSRHIIISRGICAIDITKGDNDDVAECHQIRTENSRKNYVVCCDNEGPKNISTEICRLRKETLQSFFLKQFMNFLEHEKIF